MLAYENPKSDPVSVRASYIRWLTAQVDAILQEPPNQRITAALDSTPAEPDRPTIIIDVSGGVVQSAVATEPIDAIVIDYEANEDADDDNRIYPIPQSDGSTSNAWVGEANCEVDPARVAQIVQALEAADAAAAE